MRQHRNVALLWRKVVDAPLIEKNVALHDILQAGDQPDDGRTAASGGTRQNHKLPVANREAQSRLETGGADVLKRHRGHISNERKRLDPNWDFRGEKLRPGFVETPFHITESDLFSQAIAPGCARDPAGIFAWVALAC